MDKTLYLSNESGVHKKLNPDHFVPHGLLELPPLPGLKKLRPVRSDLALLPCLSMTAMA